MVACKLLIWYQRGYLRFIFPGNHALVLQFFFCRQITNLKLQQLQLGAVGGIAATRSTSTNGALYRTFPFRKRCTIHRIGHRIGWIEPTYTMTHFRNNNYTTIQVQKKIAYRMWSATFRTVTIDVEIVQDKLERENRIRVSKLSVSIFPWRFSPSKLSDHILYLFILRNSRPNNT